MIILGLTMIAIINSSAIHHRLAVTNNINITNHIHDFHLLKLFNSMLVVHCTNFTIFYNLLVYLFHSQTVYQKQDTGQVFLAQSVSVISLL